MAADDHTSLIERLRTNIHGAGRGYRQVDAVCFEAADALEAAARALAEMTDRVVDLEHDCEELTHANTRLLERAEAAESSLAAARAAALEEAAREIDDAAAEEMNFAEQAEDNGDAELRDHFVAIADKFKYRAQRIRALSPQAEPIMFADNGDDIEARLKSEGDEPCHGPDDRWCPTCGLGGDMETGTPLRTPEGKG